MDRGADGIVGSTPAEIDHGGVDIIICRIRNLLEERNGCHHLT